MTASPMTVTVLAPLWGNGVMDTGKEWEDANEITGDGWSDTCITEYCSDGTVNNNNEEWDDGNLKFGRWVKRYLYHWILLRWNSE